MALKCLVKLSNVNNLSDARYGAGMGVEMMGFPLDEGSVVSIEDFKEMTSWIEGPKFIAEFTSPSTNRVLEVISGCHPDMIEIQDTSFIKDLAHIQIPVILRWPITKLDAVPQHLDVAYVVLEDDNAIQLSSAQKDLIKTIGEDYKILLGSGFSPANVLALCEELPIAGISLKGGDEIRAGYKDYDELADILELLEED
jgi:phosphoribosylanthranilate isomerase